MVGLLYDCNGVMGLDQTAAYTSLTVNDIRVNVSRDMVFAPLLELLVKIPLSAVPHSVTIPLLFAVLQMW